MTTVELWVSLIKQGIKTADESPPILRERIEKMLQEENQNEEESES